MAGLRLTTGYVSWHDRIASEDAHVVQILHRAGAISIAEPLSPKQ
jgi:Asp-tRNA(Asn)/Glu-tRNA(Gln) amidotransferase A subunit family amidase